MCRRCAISTIRSSAKLPTQLAMAQLGAALAQAGDVAGPARRTPPRWDRRRRGRPGCAMSITAASCATAPPCSPLPPAIRAKQPRLTEVMDRIAELFARANRTSTQEQAWLLMAAEAAARESGGDDDDRDRRRRAANARQAALSAPRTRHRRRAGHGRQSRRRPRHGAPCRSAACRRPTCRPRAAATPCPASVYRRDGTPADLSKVRQSELFVVVINGSRADPARAARTLVVDLLPAGFEIESAIPAGGRSPAGYTWLKSPTDTAYTEARDDRYVAALDLTARRQGFHAGLCRARRHAGRVHLSGARRRGHVRSGNRRPHRDRQARR